MAKRPEEVLPEQGITTRCEGVEMCSQVTVQQHHHARSRKAGQSEEQQECRNQGHPGEQWHAVNGHTWGTHPQNHYHKVKRTGDR